MENKETYKTFDEAAAAIEEYESGMTVTLTGTFDDSISDEERIKHRDHARSVLEAHVHEVLALLQGLKAGELEAAINVLRFVQKMRGFVYVAGNGGSAANATHMAAHLADVGIRALSLTDNAPLLTARANDHDYSEALWRAIPRGLLTPQDAVMVFSCSGTSHNIVELIQRAKSARTPVIGVFGFGDRNLLTLDAKIKIDSENYGAIEDVHSVIVHLIKDMMLA